jgi:hypothetical protein
VGAGKARERTTSGLANYIRNNNRFNDFIKTIRMIGFIPRQNSTHKIWTSEPGRSRPGYERFNKTWFKAVDMRGVEEIVSEEAAYAGMLVMAVRTAEQ